MKERPILFSGPMVRAILEGRKTQTRRVVKSQPPADKQRVAWYEPGVMGWAPPDVPSQHWHRVRCPYGQPGDRLWVRETFAWYGCEEDINEIVYRATCDGDLPSEYGRWRPAIHMPHWASRITLEITRVRVEQLQDISDEDAFAEGTPCYVCGRPMDGFSESDCHCFHRKARASDYQMLWESIHGPGSWAANPWVWVIDFRRVTP